MNKSLDVYFSHDQLLIISALKKTYEEEIDRLEERLKKYNMENAHTVENGQRVQTNVVHVTPWFAINVICVVVVTIITRIVV